MLYTNVVVTKVPEPKVHCHKITDIGVGDYFLDPETNYLHRKIICVSCSANHCAAIRTFDGKFVTFACNYRVTLAKSVKITFEV